MLGIGALGQLALAEFPQKVTVSAASSVAETLTFSDVFSAVQVSTVNVSETLLFVDTQNAIQTSTSDITETIALLDTTDATVVAAGAAQIFETLTLIDVTDATLISAFVPDTHDGVRKKKKKKKAVGFEEELDRREKLRKQITEVIHPPVIVPVEEPEVPSVPEVVETKPFEIKTTVTPAVDYAGLAQQEIVDKLRLDAEAKQREFLHQLELKRLADIEDEDELEMILEALL